MYDFTTGGEFLRNEPTIRIVIKLGRTGGKWQL